MVTTIPRDFYPVDGALALKEIDELVEERDSVVQHSVLLDDGEMTTDDASSLKPPILEECSTPSTFRRVTEAKMTVEQFETLKEDDGIVLLPRQSWKAFSIMVGTIKFFFLEKVEKNITTMHSRKKAGSRDPGSHDFFEQN